MSRDLTTQYRVFSITWLDFLKVLLFSFPVQVVGPRAKDFYPLQRVEITGGIFLL